MLVETMQGPLSLFDNCLFGNTSNDRAFSYGDIYPTLPLPVELTGRHRLVIRDKFIIARPLFRVIVLWDGTIEKQHAKWLQNPNYFYQYIQEGIPDRMERHTFAKSLLSALPGEHGGSRLDNILNNANNHRIDYVGTGLHFTATKYMIYRRLSVQNEGARFISKLDRIPQPEEWYEAVESGYDMLPFEICMVDLVREVLENLRGMVSSAPA